MKKIKYLLLIMVTAFMSLASVNAEENITTLTISKDTFNTNYETYIRYKSVIDEALKNYADSNDYYAITINEAGDLNDINLVIWDDVATMYYEATTYSIQFGATNYKYKIQFYNDKIRYISDNSNHENTSWRNLSSLLPDNLVDTNYNFYQKFYTTLEIEGIFSDNIVLEKGTLFPTLKQLYNYTSWNEYLDSQYTEVNLDNYEYVILNLKNYNQNTFETNLKVKGMIGITPVYEFGTVEKSDITDRCNISYADYTDYRFFILENDLINNAVYIVKKCEDNSSFKFDSTVFDITYITADTVNDPVITVGGEEYHTIPFNQLSNTANKNEEENFVPGESGSSLSDIVDNISNFSQDIWKAISSFMGLVTKFFNTLPEEFRYLSITAFTTLVFIAIIKFIKS